MLEKLYLTRLTNLESGQHIKNVHSSLTNSANITDASLLYYLGTVKNASDSYDESLIQLAKSDETQKIEAADLERDHAYSTLTRAISVFEFSKDQNEKLAFASISNLLFGYSGLQNWNYMEQTNGIDNLVAEFAKPKYDEHVRTLGLGTPVTRVKDANQAFKLLFGGRTIEEVGKPVYNTRKLRRTMQDAYTDMAEYVLAMSKLPNALPQFAKSLQLINADRKYYSDLLARRLGSGKPDAPGS